MIKLTIPMKNNKFLLFIIKRSYILVIAIIVGLIGSKLFSDYYKTNLSIDLYSKEVVISYNETESCQEDCAVRMTNSFEEYMYFDNNVDLFKSRFKVKTNLLDEKTTVTVNPNSNLIKVTFVTKNKKLLSDLPEVVVQEINSDFKNNYLNSGEQSFKIIDESEVRKFSAFNSSDKIYTMITATSLFIGLLIIFTTYDYRNYEKQ